MGKLEVRKVAASYAVMPTTGQKIAQTATTQLHKGAEKIKAEAKTKVVRVVEDSHQMAKLARAKHQPITPNPASTIYVAFAGSRRSLENVGGLMSRLEVCHQHTPTSSNVGKKPDMRKSLRPLRPASRLQH